jgi:hypothetical protein
VAFPAADKESTAEVDASGYPDKGTLRANQNRDGIVCVRILRSASRPKASAVQCNVRFWG